MKPIKKRAVSGNNLADQPAEGSSSSDESAAVSTTKVNNNNDSVSSPNNPTSTTNDKSTSATTPQSQSSTQQPSNTTKTTNNTVPTKRSHKKRESTHNKNKTQQPLFAFNAASPIINDPNNLSSTNSSSNNSTSQIGIRPKRKLKQITRFNPYSSTNSSTTSNVKCGEGFSCPRCNYVCSYDSKQCEECELECYYEAGVGVVTLKERRVSLVGSATGSSGNGGSKGSGKREGRDRKLEVKRLSEMGKGIRRKSAPPVVTTADSATPAALSRGVDDNGDTDTSGDLILTQKQSKDTTASNNTSSNTSTIPNNNTASNIEIKKVGGRPAKSRSSITNGNISNSLYQGAIINPLKCPHCSKDFLSEKGLQYHVDKKVCQRKHGNAGSNNNKPNTGAPARGRPPNKVKKQQPPPPPRRQHNNMGGKSLTEITGEGAGIIITPDTPRRVVTRGHSSGSAKKEEEEDDTNNNNIAAAAEEEEEAAAVSAIREMASLLVMGATQVADSTTPPTPKQPADTEEEVQNGSRETRSNRKKRGLDSTASLDAALTKAMLKDNQDTQQQADESSVTSATSASSGDSSSPFSSVSSAAVGRRRGEAAAAVDGKTSSGGRHPSMPVITETNVVLTNNNSSNRSTRRTRTTTAAAASSSKTTPPIAHDPQVAQQLAKLQSKYKSLLATAKRAKQDNAAKISNLESSLQSKEQEVTLANTRISTLEDDKDDLTKKLAAIDPINYNPLFDDPDNNSSKKNDDTSKLSSLFQDNDHSASNNKMSAEEDLSNCSSSEEKSVEELQHKLEEIINERDSAEEQIKELFGVQLQKDELLSQLQRTRNRLTENETKRKRDRAEFEEREKVANDDALMQRRKIIQLESLLSVVVGQRDRANSRVRELLLGGKEDPAVPRSREDNSNSQVQKMLASFKSENEHLATEAKESKAEAAILQSEKDDAIKQSTQLQVSVDELRNQVDTLRSQNFNLQQDNSFERSFQSDHDECLRVLESVNITNNLEDLDESLGRSPDSLNDSLSSEDIEALPPDIMSPRSTSAAAAAAPQQQEEEGISTPQRGSPSRKQPSDSTRGNEEEVGTSILNVPSLAEAQSEEAEENKLEELTNALDSLNEFEDFLLDLGLNSPQPRDV